MSVTSYIEKYMHDEYMTLSEEIRFVGRHLERNVSGKVLDFGCGPALLYWAMFEKRATRIDAFDILPENIAYLKKLLAMRKKPAIYRRISQDTEATVSKIGRLKVGDILKEVPFKEGYYDTVTEIGCVGCVNTEAELFKAIRNMYRHLKEGGTAVFVNWTDRRTAIAEEVPQFDGTVPVTKKLFTKAMLKAGFHGIKLSRRKNKNARSEFATMIYGTATK